MAKLFLHTSVQTGDLVISNPVTVEFKNTTVSNNILYVIRA